VAEIQQITTDDLRRMEALPGNYYNFHPGAHVGQGSDAGIQMIVDALCQVMFEGQQTTVLLETMSGKGTEVGRSFEELALIIEGVAGKRPELSRQVGNLFSDEGKPIAVAGIE